MKFWVLHIMFIIKLTRFPNYENIIMWRNGIVKDSFLNKLFTPIFPGFPAILD